MSRTQIIETAGLTRRFRGCEAVHAVDLTVPEGTAFAYLGPNGAGKTTTIRMLLGMLQPSGGASHVFGVPSGRLGRREFEQIGFVSADQKLPRRMTINELINYLKPMYPTWDDAFCSRLRTDFDLPLDRKVGALSRGMRMKTALMLALAYHPRLLVLDEPFSGLDPLVREEFLGGIIELTEQEQWTVFISSHDLDDVQRLADWVGIIDQGRLKISEPVEKLQRRFRRIRFQVEAGSREMASDPHWMEVERDGSLVRLVDTAYDESASFDRIRTAFPSAADWQVSPMSLREIFVTLARHGRRNGNNGR